MSLFDSRIQITHTEQYLASDTSSTLVSYTVCYYKGGICTVITPRYRLWTVESVVHTKIKSFSVMRDWIGSQYGNHVETLTGTDVAFIHYITHTKAIAKSPLHHIDVSDIREALLRDDKTSGTGEEKY